MFLWQLAQHIQRIPDLIATVPSDDLRSRLENVITEQFALFLPKVVAAVVSAVSSAIPSTSDVHTDADMLKLPAHLPSFPAPSTKPQLEYCDGPSILPDSSSFSKPASLPSRTVFSLVPHQFVPTWSSPRPRCLLIYPARLAFAYRRPSRPLQKTSSSNRRKKKSVHFYCVIGLLCFGCLLALFS